MRGPMGEKPVLLARLKLAVGSARAERRRVRALGAPGGEVASVVHRCQCLSCDSIECSSKQIEDGKGGTVTQVEIRRESTRKARTLNSRRRRTRTAAWACVCRCRGGGTGCAGRSVFGLAVPVSAVWIAAVAVVVTEKSVYTRFRDLRNHDVSHHMHAHARQVPVIQGPTRRVARASAAQRHCGTKEPTTEIRLLKGEERGRLTIHPWVTRAPAVTRHLRGWRRRGRGGHEIR